VFLALISLLCVWHQRCKQSIKANNQMQKFAKRWCSPGASALPVILVFFTLLFFTADAQSKKKMIYIHDPSSKIKLQHFRITKVVDNRINPSGIGYITTYSANKFLAADLEHPLPEELDIFIRKNVEQSSGAEVSLHINYFFLSEEMAAGEMAKIYFRIHFSLYNNKGERLLDASTAGDKFTGPTRGAFAGRLMGTCIETLLKELDNNLPTALKKYEDKAPIPVWIVLNNAPEDKNLLPFSPKRQLNVSNFAGREPDGSNALAGTECGFTMDYQIRMMEGVLKAVIEITPYFKQSAAWLKRGADLTQAGAYAQNQFDLTAIRTCELVNAIDSREFVFSSLKNDIETLRLEYETRIKQEIVQQTAETDGGKKIPELEDWIEKTAFNMKSIDCYEQ